MSYTYFVQWGKDHLENVKSFDKKIDAYNFASTLFEARRLRITRRENDTLTPDRLLSELGIYNS